MKISACLVILLYGCLLTFGCVALQALGSSMAGMSAGSTGRHWSLWSVWPCPVFFALSAVAPFLSERKRRVRLLGFALTVVTISAVAIYGLKDGLLFVAVIAVAALLVWIPLLVPLADTSTQADGGLR
jgi:hypothetical protein